MVAIAAHCKEQVPFAGFDERVPSGQVCMRMELDWQRRRALAATPLILHLKLWYDLY
jgi:hypothetical protein